MEQNKPKRKVLGSEALGELLGRMKDGTFKDIINDWKWIAAYTRRYRAAALATVSRAALFVTGDLAAATAELGPAAAIELARQYPEAVAAVAIHPNDAARLGDRLATAVNDDTGWRRGHDTP